MTTRVLHLTGTSIVGGAETNLLRTMQHGRREGIEPVAVLMPQDGPLAERVQTLGIPVGVIDYYGFKLPNPLRYFQTLGQLLGWVRRTRPDLVHLNLHCLAEYAYRLKQLTRLPVVCDVRGIHQGPYAAHFVPGYRRWLPALDLVIASSHAVEHDLEKWGVSTSNVIVNHESVDHREFAVASKPHVVHQELGLPQSVPLVGIVGRVNHEKGVGEFLQAASAVGREECAVHFLVVGTDDAKGGVIQIYKDLARDLGILDRVSFLGFRRDVADVLHDLTVFVLASWGEACPNSVLEAMAAGTLVVATHVGGVVEMIADGETGFIVPPRNASALAQSISRALRLPTEQRAAIVQRARERVIEQFSIEGQVNRLAERYASLLARRKRS